VRIRPSGQRRELRDVKESAGCKRLATVFSVQRSIACHCSEFLLLFGALSAKGIF
jgi:hypothetical protein